MRRCLGFTKTGKKCRSRIKDGFFCNSHLPYNFDEPTCFTCCEDISNSNDIIVLECNHFFHKPCFHEWIDHSNNMECPLCRHQIKINIKKRNNRIHSFLAMCL